MKVAIVMGSTSDWEVMKEAVEICEYFEIEYHKQVVSAHRTPELMFDFASKAKQNQFCIIIAGAGGAAHLPGMIASLTTLPVIGVPIKSKCLNGIDSLLSIAQMPGGVPVATVAINQAKNAALLAISILAITNSELSTKLIEYRQNMKNTVLEGVI